ncbi:MAG: hypothetical protein FWG98_00110 [Candidatus Cloacimonetes bacterium]|nr:hypothetical protein [Candidatus Cloacimonadota bacterium]
MLKKITFATIFLLMFWMLNAQMMSARQRHLRINLGGGVSWIIGEDVKNKDDNHVYEPQFNFGAGLSWVGDSPDKISFEPGIRYVMRGFDEIYDKDSENPRYEGTSISYIDVYGKIKYGIGQFYMSIGSGVAIAPFTEHYNTFNVPLMMGFDYYFRPNIIFGMDIDILLLDMPVKDAYPNFNKVKGITGLFTVSFLI